MPLRKADDAASVLHAETQKEIQFAAEEETRLKAGEWYQERIRDLKGRIIDLDASIRSKEAWPRGLWEVRIS